VYTCAAFVCGCDCDDSLALGAVLPSFVGSASRPLFVHVLSACMSASLCIRKRWQHRTSPPLPAPSQAARPALYATLCERVPLFPLVEDADGRHPATSQPLHAVSRLSSLPGVCGQPQNLRGGVLRDYQLKGIDWMYKAWCDSR
jgi:hypothetical protein